ncbi:hypothetical protein [Synechococcus elongatus]|uniref:hypothetical protein n=1 Tax=Synechococcus elongatus TaxID=32046 RepID=UPI0030D3C993
MSQHNKNEKWLPKPVHVLEQYLEQFLAPIEGFESDQCRGMRKNIAYSLQHLEFISYCLSEINTTSVIYTQNIKTFIIVSCSVIEALFFYLLRSKNKFKTTCWQPSKKLSGQEFKDSDGKTKRVDIEIFEKTSLRYKEMNFDSMCKSIQTGKIIKFENDDFFKNLNYLRKIRNRIHVHIIKNSSDTDYLKINYSDYNLAKGVLSSLMTSELFSNPRHDLFEYLKIIEISDPF